MRIRTIALAIPLIGLAACKTSSTQTAQGETISPIGTDAALLNRPKQAPPPVAATERGGNAPANRAENQPGAGVGATAPGRTSDTAASGSQAAGASARADGDLKAHSDDDVISGTISRVSEQSLTISSQDGSQRTLELVPQTSVMVNGQEARSTDLQEGLPVRASFSLVEDRDVAVDVRAGSASREGATTGAAPSDSTFPGTPGAGGQPEGSGGAAGRGATGGATDQPSPNHLPKRD